MAQLTAIELSPKRLVAATVRANGHGAEILKGGAADLLSLDADSVRRALETCGVSDVRAILLIPRGQAILREFDLPEGSPEELVQMVRFQVERQMPLPVDQLHYSYIETGRGAGKVHVQVVAVPRETLDPVLAAVEGAGLKVSQAFISSFGLLALYPNGGPAALVEVSGREAEIMVVEKGRMEFSRTAALADPPSAAALAEEVGRTLLTYGARFPGKPVQKVVLAGDGPAAEKLAQELGVRLDRDVIHVGPGDLETAAVAGICLGVSRGSPLPDLLKPPVAVKSFKVTKVHRIAGAAVLVLAMLVAWAQVALSSKGAQLARRRTELKGLEPQAAEVQRMSHQTALAHQWYRDRYSWLDTFTVLSQQVDRGKLWIQTMTFEDTGSVRIVGKAKDDKNIAQFVTALKGAASFRDARADNQKYNGDKSEYRWDFTVTAQLVGFDPKKKKP